MVRASFVLAWAGLEAAMRRAAGVSDGRAVKEASPRGLLSQFYSSGFLSRDEFNRLNTAWLIRTEIVHGFMPPQLLDVNLVRDVIGAARRLNASAAPVTTAAG